LFAGVVYFRLEPEPVSSTWGRSCGVDTVEQAVFQAVELVEFLAGLATEPNGFGISRRGH